MRYLFFTFLTLLLMLSHTRTAESGAYESKSVWQCDHGFTLSYRTKEGKSFYHLHGSLDTPTPGYTHNLEVVSVDTDTKQAKLTLFMDAKLTRSMQVVTPHQIHNDLDISDPNLEVFEVKIDKSYNWGPEAITCQLETG